MPKHRSDVWKRATVLVVVLTTTFLLMPLQLAMACTLEGQVSLLQEVETLDESRVVGVYEQTTISSAPAVVLRGEATASVVTRYWGEPPENVGVQYEGGTWFPFLPDIGADSCAGLVDSEGRIVYSDGSSGTVGYGLAHGPEIWRSAPALGLENGGFTGELSQAEEDALEEAFGPAVELEVTGVANFGATVRVWLPTLIVLGTAVGLVVWATRRLARR